MTSNVNRYGNWWQDNIAQQILQKKYFHDNELKLMKDKGFEVAFKAFVGRVSGIFSNQQLKDFMAESLMDGDFLPAGRSLYAAGAKDKFKASMSNCYILRSPEDDLEDIYKVAGEMARIFSRGGGCGVDLSNLRPEGATVHNAAKTSSGVTSFMEVYNSVGEIVGAHGRRAALLMSLDCTHPEIEEFLKIKQNNTAIQKANISIRFTDDFMRAVINNDDFELKFTVKDTGDTITKTINARDFFYKFAEAQWDYAEPAALFIDTIRKGNLLSGYPESEYKIEVTNPCAEFSGSSYNSCNLGSINLYNFVDRPFTEQAYFDFSRFKDTVKNAVEVLDEILDYGYDNQPLDANRKCIDDWRSIGLGVFGVADMFVAMNTKYGSTKSIELIRDIMDTMNFAALQKSMELAKEKKPFGKFNWKYVSKSKFMKYLNSGYYDWLYTYILKHGLRNGTLLAIAPTGSLSMLFRESGGVEPYYQVSYDRTTHELEKQNKTFKISMLAVEHLLKANNLPLDTPIDEIKKRFPYVIDTYDIEPTDRITLQATMQNYVDNAISSTINLKESATVEDIFNLYISAWKQGCKGITVFRDNCARISILGKDHGVSTESLKSDSKPIEPTKAEENRPVVVDKLDEYMPIKRGDNIQSLWGRTFLFHTACVPKFYVTVNIKDNEIFEVFVGADKGCQANISTITRLTSLCLRGGLKVDEIIKNLNSAVCPACTALRNKGDKTINKSCASCIASAIIEMRKTLNGGKSLVKSDDFKEVKEVPKEIKMVVIPQGKMQCPECGEYTLIPDGKCAYCNNCGYSKC